MTTLELIRGKREEILRAAMRHGVTGIRLFGSVARGDARPDSDVDFLVETGAKTTPWFPAGLIVELEDMLGRRVDVVTQRGLNPDLRERVLAEAIQL
jgi:predicted nucleotidyltransferase